MSSQATDIVREAHRRDRELGSYVMLGIRQGQRLGFRTASRIITAYKRGGDVLGRYHAMLTPLADLLRETMVVTHIVGLLQVYRRVPGLDVALASSPFGQAIRVLRRRARLSLAAIAELRAQYDAVATQMVTRASAAAEKRLQEAMWRITAEGMHVREGAVELQKAFEASGLGGTRSYTIEAIMRTQTQIANAAGQWQAARDPVVDEILWGWRYYAVGDQRTRPTHAAMDGMTLPKDDPRWLTMTPPNGYNCRCTLVEIFDRVPRGGVKEPPQTTADDKGRTLIVSPDRGFAWNPGEVYGRLAA